VENEKASEGPSAFGSLLRRYRLAAGLSQEALAERARISVQGIGALERGDRRTPQRETLSLLTAALALTADQRLGFEEAAVRHGAARSTRAAVSAAPSWSLTFSLTTIVGRESEVGEIAKLVREHRLVTLTGPGGIGKTRTALDVGALFSDPAGGGVRLVELAPLGEAKLVAETIAAALGIQEVPNRPLLATLLAYLRSTKLLLVLDNCEHLIKESALVVDSLLRGTPMLRVLATSREPLRVAGERVYRLPSLAAPPLGKSDRLSTTEAAAFPAVRLFVERAQAVDHNFSLTDENAQVIAEICQRLEGIPLAIELAAARVSVLSPPALAEKLSRRFVLLSGGGRTALPRQQTMRAAIDWSYELLSQHERRLFERFSIFAGGCALESAIAVCADEGEDQHEVFDVLSSLVDKSLIVADVQGPAPRYRMLETFRQYAREKLIEHGELDAARRRHAAVHLKLAEDTERLLRDVPDRAWNARARLELDNWRAAIEWAFSARGDVALGQSLVASLRMIWASFATAEGRRWVRLALGRADERTAPEVAAELERTDASLSEQLGEFSAALAAALRAIARYRDLADPVGTARSQAEAGTVLVRLGRTAEAEPLLAEALAVARAHGRDAFCAKILLVIADARALRGDYTEARAACARGLSMVRALGKGRSVAIALTTRAELEFRAGAAEAALLFAAEALQVCSGQEDRESVESAVHANMAAYLVTLARFDDARAHAREALDTSRRLHFPLHTAWALQHLAAIAVLRPQPDPKPIEELLRAARLMGFVEARYADLGTALEPTDKQEYDRVNAALRTVLPPGELEFTLTRGAAMSEDDAIEDASQL
jgi:predicted ATPase/DNA-binding XRE family transcriptional regulator